MNRKHDKAADMIQRAITDIGKSAYPSSEFVLGAVEAMYHMGHISEDQQLGYTQAAFDAVAARRKELRQDDAQRRDEQRLERIERRAARAGVNACYVTPLPEVHFSPLPSAQLA